MILQTRKDKARNILETWDRQYRGTAKNLHWKTRKNLEALNGEGTPEQVNSIIGNTSWTDCVCDECMGFAEVVVQIEKELEFRSNIIWICERCLKDALKLIKEGK